MMFIEESITCGFIFSLKKGRYFAVSCYFCSPLITAGQIWLTISLLFSKVFNERIEYEYRESGRSEDERIFAGFII